MKNNVMAKQLNEMYITQIHSLEQVRTYNTYVVHVYIVYIRSVCVCSAGGSSSSTRVEEGTDYPSDTAVQTTGEQQRAGTNTVGVFYAQCIDENNNMFVHCREQQQKLAEAEKKLAAVQKKHRVGTQHIHTHHHISLPSLPPPSLPLYISL